MKNELLTCIRLAIKAGAGLLIPHAITMNSVENRGKKIETSTSNIKFADIFDENHFTSTMKSACPQMELHNDVESVRKALTGEVKMVSTVSKSQLKPHYYTTSLADKSRTR